MYDEAAEELARARLKRRRLAALTESLRPHALDDAYRIQARLAARLETELGAVIGWKVGCTTRVMQDYLKIAHPCAGAMFESTVHRHHDVFRRDGLVRPGAECEIAVELGPDLPADRDIAAADAGAYVRAAMASIELVDDRWTDFRTVGAPTLVAENFFNAGCVLGAPHTVDPATLDRLAGTMCLNGREVGRGRGADILGHPLEALAWLANHRRGQGRPLRGGEVVTLGSIVQTAWIEAGDGVEVDVEGLGGCSLHLV